MEKIATDGKEAVYDKWLLLKSTKHFKHKLNNCSNFLIIKWCRNRRMYSRSTAFDLISGLQRILISKISVRIINWSIFTCMSTHDLLLLPSHEHPNNNSNLRSCFGCGDSVFELCHRQNYLRDQPSEKPWKTLWYSLAVKVNFTIIFLSSFSFIVIISIFLSTVIVMMLMNSWYEPHLNWKVCHFTLIIQSKHTIADCW